MAEAPAKSRKRDGVAEPAISSLPIGFPATGPRNLISPADPIDVAAVADRIADNVALVIEGKQEMIRLGLAVLLAEGHLLLEDVPGVGKTTFAKALARSINATVRRVQFTPDLLPSDITGVSVYNGETREFEFKPGAVFANIVIGDEINRASPKTQAALLECMEEQQVTVDGTSYRLESPFLVIATQNPVDMEGTYPLPEAQRDRFTARLSMGYPDRRAEIEMLSEHAANDPLADLTQVCDAAEIRAAVQAARAVYLSEPVKAYAVDIAEATRTCPDLRLGASPRATLQLVRTAKAWAALAKRDFVLPDDLIELAVPVLAHRLIVTADAQLRGHGAGGVLRSLIERLPVPAGHGR